MSLGWAALLGPLLLIVHCRADKGASQPYTPQVKYGGPIVYSGEKPPIIHFPPPPEVSPPQR